MNRALANVLVTVAIAAVAVAGIGAVQPSLARDAHAVKRRDDAVLLPPPRALRAMTLGYRSAAVDLLWADLLIESGVHWQEKRAFPDLPRYVDGILALEPDFPTIYRYVDTLLVFGPTGGTAADARKARAYLERGTKARPYDPEVWEEYGQFVAFLAPTFLKDEKEIEKWRLDGAKALLHAVDLGADAQRSLAATTILSRSGETAAAIEATQRLYAMTDDPDIKNQMFRRMQSLKAQSDAELAVDALDREIRTRYGSLTRTEALLVGPHRAPSLCAGPGSFDRPECPRDWTAAAQSSK